MMMTTRPIHLLCEGSINPLGIDRPQPLLSWNFPDTGRGHFQSAYQIQMAASLEDLLANRAILWDSDKVISSQNIAVVYSGAALNSGQLVFWRVRTWDQNGHPGPTSVPAWFEMGLLHPEDWQADWIGFPTFTNGCALFLRHEFSLQKPIARARIYAAGLGYFEIHLNGKALANYVLNPAPTNYARRVLYSTFDVSELLLLGSNTVGAVVGNGWYGIPKLVLQINLEYTDGTTDRILTGKHGQGGASWRIAQGPILENGVFNGEKYDARLENSAWNQPGVSDEDFFPFAMLVEPPGGKLVAQDIEQIRVMETLSPLIIQQPKPRVYTIDYGQNLAGWVRLNVNGKCGSRVSLRFSETLYEDGTVNQENLRTALATDEYILNGKGTETWEPHFTYHGFRYVQVEGLPEPPGPETVQARVVRTSFDRTGNFECEHPLLNQIYKMVHWTEASNWHGIPTDCPQRDERMGWMNDLAARTEEALYNFNLQRAFSKFTTDIEEAQDALGAIPDTVPYRWGNRPADPVSIAYLLIPWQLYRWYGDHRVLSEHYEGMKKWVNFLFSKAEENLLAYSYYGDWAPPVAEAMPGSDGASPISRQTPGVLVSTAFLAYHARLMSQIALILGRSEDGTFYQQRADAVKQAYHLHFWNEEEGGYGSNNQACNTLSLYMDLVPNELRVRVLDSLIRDVEDHEYHLTTGNLCTKYLLEVLSQSGRGDVAFRLATQTTYPSWGYMIENGATTVWERWERATGGGMNSHNHPMLASVGSWLYKYVAGLDLEPDSVAFNPIRIYPRTTEMLGWARAGVETVHGLAAVAWQRNPNEFILTVKIPANCQGKVYIPRAAEHTDWVLWEGNQLLWKANNSPNTIEGISNPYSGLDALVCEVSSGDYSFRLEYTN